MREGCRRHLCLNMKTVITVNTQLLFYPYDLKLQYFIHYKLELSLIVMSIPPIPTLSTDIRQTIKHHLDDLNTLEGVWDTTVNQQADQKSVMIPVYTPSPHIPFVGGMINIDEKWHNHVTCFKLMHILCCFVYSTQTATVFLLPLYHLVCWLIYLYRTIRCCIIQLR